MAKMKKCKVCLKEIASNAKICPGCGAKNKKTIYKRPWFIVLVILMFIGIINQKSTTTSSRTDAPILETSQNTNTVEEKGPINSAESTEEVAPTGDIKDAVPREYKSALKSAETYSKIMHMSKVAIYDQLTSEYGDKFAAEEAQYAIDNLTANWKENALESANSYSETMHMSKAAVYNQLISEYGDKFTEEEAQYAIDNINANWKENALESAKTYSDVMSMSKAAIYDQLISEYGDKFTVEEAQYAIDNMQ